MIPQSWPSRIEEVELLDEELEVVDVTKLYNISSCFLRECYWINTLD